MDWAQLWEIASAPDNIPIVALLFLVPFYTWYGLRQARANDRLIEQLEATTPKTKPFGGLAETFKVTRRSVIVLDQPTEMLLKSLRNLAHFELRQAANLNAFDVLNAHKILLTKSAFERLQHRVVNEGNGDSPATPAAPAPAAAVKKTAPKTAARGTKRGPGAKS